MKIGPLMKVFGSKWQSAKRYPPPLEGLTLFEPYAGGAGYALNHVDYDVTIWESNQQLIDLWAWLIDECPQDEIARIPINVPVGTDIRTLDLNTGQMLLLKHWQRTNNYGNCWTISKWGSLPGQWTENTRARVADQVGAVHHWKLERPTYREQGTYFCDAPYLYNYRYGCKSFDFEAYANNVNGIPKGSLVIACEAVCPKTGATPNYLPFVSSHSQVTSRRKPGNSHHSKEMVYIRNP